MLRPIIVATLLLGATCTTVWAQQTDTQPSNTPQADQPAQDTTDQEFVRADDITDEEALRQLMQKYTDAFVAKDVDAVMALYDRYALVFDVVPPRQYIGTEGAYRKDWENYLGSFTGTPKFEITNLVVSAEGNFGYGTSIQKVSGTDTKDQPFEFAFRVTDVFHKNNTGEWLIVHEHVSVPVNLETNTPDLLSHE